jgi:hypothetical protein
MFLEKSVFDQGSLTAYIHTDRQTDRRMNIHDVSLVIEIRKETYACSLRDSKLRP